MKSQIETERKYIIAMPTSEKYSCMGSTESEIEQIYLAAESGVTHRIRRRSFGERVEYTETEKRRVGIMSAVEREWEITEERYADLALKIDKKTSPIYKRRITFTYRDTVCEVDIYPQWKSTAIMEIELPTEDTEPNIPPFIRVLREVTGQRAYSNRAMAECFPPEPESDN